MRISNNPAMTQSSTSTARHHPQLLAAQHITRVTSIVEGYDFGRARSSESTENTLTGKGGGSSIVTTRTTLSSPPRTAVSSSPSFAEEEEARGVPVSPIKMPPTPPRDHGSPYRPGNFQSAHAHAQAQAQVVTPDHSRLLQPPSAFARSQQPFLQPQQLQHHQQMPMHTFLRPSSSSWRQKEEGHGGASIFRSSPMLQSQQYSEGCLSREHDSYYTIQRSPAFDDYSDSDEDDGTANENESHNYVENFIFNMRAESR